MKSCRFFGQIGLFLVLACIFSSGPAAGGLGAELKFDAEGGTLSGSLFLPPGEGPFPAVIFLAGSGDESYRTGWEGERRSWFWPELQAWFESRGWAVYVFDKPGVGHSEGHWRSEDFHGRKRNALAALDTLASQPQIDPTRIGLLGHSQGGWIAMMAAADRPEQVAFLISLAGPAIGVRQQIMEDTANRWTCEEKRMTGLRRAGLGLMLSSMSGIGRVMSMGYLSRIVRYDPADDLAQIQQPMLALFAANDIMVMPSSNLPRLEQHFGRATGHGRLSTETVDGVDHFFRAGEFCLGGNRPRTFAPAFWEALESSEFWEWVAPEA